MINGPQSVVISRVHDAHVWQLLEQLQTAGYRNCAPNYAIPMAAHSPLLDVLDDFTPRRA
ncbi:MAG: hypothetical protein R2867_27760 [Caldilineaceae bacterium]